MSPAPRIQYQTEGKVTVECRHGNAKPFAMTWLENAAFCQIHSGGVHIELSKSQLEILAELAMRISYDLQPGRVEAAK